MVKLTTGIAKFAISIIGGIGSILLIIGIFPLFSKGEIGIVATGLVFSIIGEIGNIYMVKFEEKKNIDTFRLNFWSMLGANYAFPVVMLAIYIMSQDKFTLVFAMALSASAIIRTVSMLVKITYIEGNAI